MSHPIAPDAPAAAEEQLEQVEAPAPAPEVSPTRVGRIDLDLRRPGREHLSGIGAEGIYFDRVASLRLSVEHAGTNDQPFLLDILADEEKTLAESRAAVAAIRDRLSGDTPEAEAVRVATARLQEAQAVLDTLNADLQRLSQVVEQTLDKGIDPAIHDHQIRILRRRIDKQAASVGEIRAEQSAAEVAYQAAFRASWATALDELVRGNAAARKAAERQLVEVMARAACHGEALRLAALELQREVEFNKAVPPVREVAR